MKPDKHTKENKTPPMPIVLICGCLAVAFVLFNLGWIWVEGKVLSIYDYFKEKCT